VVKRAVDRRTFPMTLAAGLAVGGLAIASAVATDNSPLPVLFSGEPSFGGLFAQATTISLSTLALLIVFKRLAWVLSLASFRGGPTFPALFLGVVAGLLAAHLPGYTSRPSRSPRWPPHEPARPPRSRRSARRLGRARRLTPDRGLIRSG
jgi:H+/Cl- antiporter ClcA